MLDKNALFIYHHLGLGDHIICNGFVRKLSENYNHVYLFCKQHNIDTISFMYRDLHKLDFIVGNDNIPVSLLNQKIYNFVVMGYYGENAWPWMEESIRNKVRPLGEDNMIQFFARQAKLDYNCRWNNFYINRDYERESNLFKDYGLQNQEEYIFIHDDPNRGFNINLNLITSPLKRVIPIFEKTTNIFDYCKILENAKEIHCMDSSFKILCEHLNTTDKLYYHQYVKNSDTWGTPMSKKNWIVL